VCCSMLQDCYNTKSKRIQYDLLETTATITKDRFTPNDIHFILSASWYSVILVELIVHYLFIIYYRNIIDEENQS